jgi:hypothetical protein
MQVHRFRDSVGVHIAASDNGTAYLSWQQALEIARALVSVARSIKDERFADSSGNTHSFDFPDATIRTLSRTDSGKAKRVLKKPMKPVRDRDLSRAVADYNAARGIEYGKGAASIGYVMYADIRGDGSNRKGFYAVHSESGGLLSWSPPGVGPEWFKGTKRQRLAAIEAATEQESK